MTTWIEQKNAAIAFVEDNLAQCCAELLKWSATGVLQNGKVREAAKLCKFAGRDALPLAENIIKQAAFEFTVASLPTQPGKKIDYEH